MPLLLALALLLVPRGLDLFMPVPEDNPLTEEQIATGRRLFHDRRLSRDGTVACASCHAPARAFTDGRARPMGVEGRIGRRNAPTLINRGYGRTFSWDGRSTTLEEQVLQPIQDPNEMDLSLPEASARVGMTASSMARALASYVRSLLAGDAPVDRYTAGDRSALTPEEQRGLQVFRGAGHCSDCHAGATFTDEQFHNTGVAAVSAAPGTFADAGRFAVTGNPADRGAFKTPTLREVARTAPFMHDGSIATLEEVVNFYDRGGRPNPALDPDLHPLGLSDADKRALVAFLRALSGTVLQ